MDKKIIGLLRKFADNNTRVNVRQLGYSIGHGYVTAYESQVIVVGNYDHNGYGHVTYETRENFMCEIFDRTGTIAKIGLNNVVAIRDVVVDIDDRATGRVNVVRSRAILAPGADQKR